MTKRLEKAEDYGKKWFANGYTVQTVYSVLQDGKCIKQLIDTTGKEKIAVIIIGFRAKNGVALPEMKEMIYDIKFTTNEKKNFGYGERKIIVKA